MIPETPPVYDDLAVATENYYLSEDADVDALKIKEEGKDEQSVYQFDDDTHSQSQNEDGGKKKKRRGAKMISTLLSAKASRATTT